MIRENVPNKHRLSCVCQYEVLTSSICLRYCQNVLGISDGIHIKASQERDNSSISTDRPLRGVRRGILSNVSINTQRKCIGDSTQHSPPEPSWSVNVRLKCSRRFLFASSSEALLSICPETVPRSPSIVSTSTSGSCIRMPSVLSGFIAGEGRPSPSGSRFGFGGEPDSGVCMADGVP